MMGETDAAEKLGVARHALIDPRHSNQDQADAMPVHQIAEMFDRSGGEAFCLIDDERSTNCVRGRLPVSGLPSG